MAIPRYPVDSDLDFPPFSGRIDASTGLCGGFSATTAGGAQGALSALSAAVPQTADGVRESWLGGSALKDQVNFHTASCRKPRFHSRCGWGAFCLLVLGFGLLAL